MNKSKAVTFLGSFNFSVNVDGYENDNGWFCNLCTRDQES